ncbi:MAG: orotidine 5'-phosphate decarboxylase [Nitrososphaeria archaeon]|jgi:orotidine-5'-phosphate decarboxylase
MAFAQRIREASVSKKSRVVVGLDLTSEDFSQLAQKAEHIIDLVQGEICAVKINFHLIIPLGISELSRIVTEAHKHGLQAIADIKLNDISSTNLAATEILWKVGFDAVISNPFVGFVEGLGPCLDEAHKRGKGMILLIYMSHRGAVENYELDVLYEGQVQKMYDLFVQRAISWAVDGLVVGATKPEIIAHVKEEARGIPIFSPGLIAQGGDPKEAVKAGADYLIVARGIIAAADPLLKAREIRAATW